MPTPAEQLAELQQRRARYVEAEANILKSQDYTVGDGVVSRRNRRADLAEVRDEIRRIDDQIAALENASSSGGRRILYGVPRR